MDLKERDGVVNEPCQKGWIGIAIQLDRTDHSQVWTKETLLQVKCLLTLPHSSQSSDSS